jgi:hypothetical protein
MPEAEKIRTLAAKYLKLFTDNGFEPRPLPEGQEDMSETERLGHVANLLKEVPSFISKQSLETAKGVLTFSMKLALDMGFCTRQEFQIDVKILEG